MSEINKINALKSEYEAVTSVSDISSKTKALEYRGGEQNDVKFEIETRSGTNSIFVKAFQSILNLPDRKKRFNYYDFKEKRIVQPSVMLKAHLISPT